MTCEQICEQSEPSASSSAKEPMSPPLGWCTYGILKAGFWVGVDLGAPFRYSLVTSVASVFLAGLVGWVGVAVPHPSSSLREDPLSFSHQDLR